MPLSPSHLAPRRPAAPTLHGRYVLVALHGRTYAVEAARVKHVLRAETMQGGEIVFLGAAHAVIDLRALLGFPDWDGPSEGPRARVAVLVSGGVGLVGALLVDAIVNLVLLPLDEIGSLPLDYPSPERRWLHGLARVEGRDVPVFDVDALLPHRLERRYAQGLAG